MSVHSIQRKRRRDPARVRYRSMGCHEEFLSRISKTLYYGQLPKTERFSLPVTELAAELFSEVKSGRSLDRLHLEEAAEISRNACVSPCSFVLAMLYLERLKISNPEYVDQVSSSELFLVSSLVASKFLNDDGEEDEVFNSEWALSADIELKDLNKLEKDFLSAMNWEVYVKELTFWNQLEKLEQDIAFKEGKKRGWFSYTDLSRLLDFIDSITLAQTVFSVSAVCLTAYAAGVASIVGSTALVSVLHRPVFQSQSPLSNQSHPTGPLLCSPILQDKMNLTDDYTLPFASSDNCWDNVEDRTFDIAFDECSETNSSNGCLSTLTDLIILNDCNQNSSSNCYNARDDGIIEDSLSSVSYYILSTVAQPLFSYRELVATH